MEELILKTIFLSILVLTPIVMSVQLMRFEIRHFHELGTLQETIEDLQSSPEYARYKKWPDRFRDILMNIDCWWYHMDYLEEVNYKYYMKIALNTPNRLRQVSSQA